MKNVVVIFNGSQYRISEGQKFETTGFIGRKGEEIEINEVLLLEDEDKVTLGKPLVKNARVKVEVIGQKLGEKLTIGKFKAKTGYRRKMGFRPQETTFLVKQIVS